VCSIRRVVQTGRPCDRGGRGSLLEAAPAAVQRVAGEADSVTGSITTIGSCNSSVVAVLNPVKPSTAKPGVARAKTCREQRARSRRLLRAALHHVRQP
jgi:hypothetical protein